MRAPEFWQEGSNSPWPGLLAPASLLWCAGARLRQRLARPKRLAVPVICVGNLVAGGAGKTPTVIAIARRLLQRERQLHFVSRGYGGQLHGPLQVNPARHSARQVGDEALLLAAIAPTWIARDRAAGAMAAAAAGAELILLDDGHQNPTLHKDLSLVVIDADYGHGNGRLIPAGPLREPVLSGLARADAVVVIGTDRPRPVNLLAEMPMGLPVLRAKLVPGAGSAAIARQKVLAFAGIGRPEKFFTSLRELGCSVVFAHAFPDHHAYAPEEIMRVVEAAAAAAAFPVTTAKDWVRLSPEARRMVRSVDVELQFADTAVLDRLLAPLSDG